MRDQHPDFVTSASAQTRNKRICAAFMCDVDRFVGVLSAWTAREHIAQVDAACIDTDAPLPLRIATREAMAPACANVVLLVPCRRSSAKRAQPIPHGARTRDLRLIRPAL